VVVQIRETKHTKHIKNNRIKIKINNDNNNNNNETLWSCSVMAAPMTPE